MLYGLKEEIFNKLSNIFSHIAEIEEVVIYGSRAKGNHKTSSDIDITIKGQYLSLTILNKISMSIDDLLLPYSFDISIYHHLKNKELIEHIDRVGKTLYKKQHSE